MFWLRNKIFLGYALLTKVLIHAVKALARLLACTDSHEHSLLADVMRKKMCAVLYMLENCGLQPVIFGVPILFSCHFLRENKLI